MSFYDDVYKAVMAIPEGKVATYGQIAALAGRPRAARVVGYALHKNPMPGVIPCHRVVNAKGFLAKSFAFGGIGVQYEMLLNEGVVFLPDGAVDMEKCRWRA